MADSHEEIQKRIDAAVADKKPVEALALIAQQISIELLSLHERVIELEKKTAHISSKGDSTFIG